ncbi:MAG TPA: hypothetical protein DEP63_03260 [Candidatus Magasanikbacteria bacterium]|nr:hypothetical protein [Candidatus Magasanikbacteria bacterium]HCC13741.1 hypothetical protein [Candidatus Magasanikbacteria bacterium]
MDTVKAILLLHFYNGVVFLGQKLQWVECPDTSALCILIDLLAQGRQASDFQGTPDCPTESIAYRTIRQLLDLVYQNRDRLDQFATAPEWSFATSVRVMQIMTDSPFGQPRRLSL